MNPFRQLEHVNFLEIGVQNGGSAQMWKSYFHGSTFKYTGIDIDPRCKQLEKDGFEVVIGDQGDTDFLEEFVRKNTFYDIILDDGGHTMDQQINSFIALFSRLNNGGIYIVEDTHTSYMPSHGGGLGNQASFIEYIKKEIDNMHGWYNEPVAKKRSETGCRDINCLAIYDSIVVIEKRRKNPPMALAIGERGHVKTPDFQSYRDIVGFTE